MIKAEVREMTRDEAIIMMVESNLQRSVILPSEKAYSYKMRYEALKRIAGTRTDGEVSESASQVKRFMRLTELNPEILDLVDQGKIGLRPAVELSYLSRHEQDMLVEAMEYADCTPSHAQAIRLRAFSKDGTLGPHVIENVMNEEKPNQREKISLRYWLFCRDELVVVWVNFDPHAPADFLFLAFSLLPLFIINHVATRLSLYHPGEASSHRKGRTPGP